MNLQTKTALAFGLLLAVVLSATVVTVGTVRRQNNALTDIKAETEAVTSGSAALLLTAKNIALDVLEAIGFALPFTVVASDAAAAHLAFTLDEATVSRFRGIPAPAERAAA